MNQDNCNICASETKKLVECPYCSMEACRPCWEQYLVNTEIPKCMFPSCGKEWTRHMLSSTMTQNFMTKKYKEHVETVLFDKERALLPATQAKAEETMETRRLTKQLQEHDKKRLNFQKESDTLSKVVHSMYSVFQNCLIYDVMTSEEKINHNNLLLRIEERRKEITLLLPNEKMLCHELQILLSHVSKKERKIERMFRCSETDCRGFVDAKGYCGLCDKTTCVHCHHAKTADHECDPQEVATAQLLAHDSKPCPSCTTFIFKIDGCDQMWCTQCHTAFSWRTGTIETRIHNPHYFEWQRTHGVLERNPNDIECGREMDHRLAGGIASSLRLRSGVDPLLPLMISKIISTTLHLREVELPAYRVDNVQDNEPIRLAYLVQDIDERVFRIQLQQENKKHAKKREIGQILQMYIQCTTDIVFRFIQLMKKTRRDLEATQEERCLQITTEALQEERKEENIEYFKLLEEVPVLVKYVNAQLARIAKDYQCVKKAIQEPSLCTQNGDIYITIEKKTPKKKVPTQIPTQVIDLIN